MTRYYLDGPIDTVEEVELVSKFLYEQQYLDSPLSMQQIKDFLEIKRRNTAQRYIDTPTEVKLFLDYLRKNRIMHGAVDEAYELEIFNKMQENGLFGDSTIGLPIPQIKFQGKPLPNPRKRKRSEMDDEDDEDELDNKFPR